MNSFIDLKGVSSGLIISVEKFCENFDIPPPALKKYKNDERIPLSKWFDIIRYLDAHYHQPDLGLKLGSLVQPNDIGILSYLCMSCENVEQVFELFVKYQRIWYDFLPIQLSTIENNIVISWENPTYFEAGLYTRETLFSVDIAFSIFFNILSFLTYPCTFNIDRVDFTLNQPLNDKMYEDYFNCTINFNTQYNRIYYNKDILKIKTSKPYFDKNLKLILQEKADALLLKYPQQTTFSELVCHHIMSSLTKNHYDLEYISEKMQLSSRLVQYRLKQEGFSFSQKLEEVRKSLSIQYLETSELSIHEISSLLAYNEQTSFNRAFKKWFGISPLQYRIKNKFKITSSFS